MVPPAMQSRKPPVVIAVLGVWMCFAARQPTDGSLAPGWYRRAGTDYVPPLQGRGEHGLPENEKADGRISLLSRQDFAA